MIKENKDINLDIFAHRLGIIKIEKLNIFSINYEFNDNRINRIASNEGSEVTYREMNINNFRKFLSRETHDFLSYNLTSLYILRDGNYLDIKNIFSIINNTEVNLGRGGSQKSHIISPLDFRLSSYLMAMFNFDYNLIKNLNTFDSITKDKYLSYKDMSKKKDRLFKDN